MSGHVHCFERFPEQPVWCSQYDDTPVLEVGDRITAPDGRVFDALPAWMGSYLVVKRDWTGAQVATLKCTEPSADERELAAAGTAERRS